MTVTNVKAVPAWPETQPIPLDKAGRPVGADGIPLFGPARSQALAELEARGADQAARAKAGADAVAEADVTPKVAETKKGS